MMRLPLPPTVLPLAVCLALAGLSGCAVRGPGAKDHRHDHAYISYWPPAENGGLRLAVKDLIDLKGQVTTAGSEYFQKNSPPARQDAACLAIARERKVQIVGKTNTTELAVGVSGINRYFGTPKNPLTKQHDRVPGGSSCGSAVAVASGTADVAFGTDTCGSIRVPAACCGVFGLKTTFGLVPVKGVYPIAPMDLDTVGPLAKDVPRLAEGMDLLQRGFASRYRAAQAEKPTAGKIKIGRLYVPGTDPKIDQAIDEALAAAGFQVVKLGKEFQEQWEHADQDAETVASSCAWEYDHKFKKLPGIQGRTKAIFLLGEVHYKTDYKAALHRKKAWQAAMARVLQQVDFVATPTLKTLPPRVPLFGGSIAFEALFLGNQNTAAVNFAGNPALAVPIPVDDRSVPLTSLQLIGRPLSEAQLVNAGRLLAGGRE